uniref:Hsp70-binding protein 1 n=1 Tax=Pseudonaja textilis TaxID=8673 RepID=A0A670ZIB0_PSETE
MDFLIPNFTFLELQERQLGKRFLAIFGKRKQELSSFTVLVICLHVRDLHPRSPTMAEGGTDGNQPPREHPRNLQGLLQMAVMAGNAEPGQTEPMSDERRQWLQEAMVEAFRGQMDEVEQMKECLRILEELSPGAERGESSEEMHSDLDRRESALDVLAELCENLDNAADFCKLEGMRLLVHRYLEHEEQELRWRTAHLVGTCAQNVPMVQEQALALGCMRKLLRLLDHDPSEAVRIKALFAISCLVRAQEAGLQQFLRLDGFSVLMRAMQSNVQKLKVKSAFLLQNLLINHPEQKETLCSMGMVQQLVALVQSEHSTFHEHVLGALCSLVTDFPQGVRECQEPELALEELLKERCRLLRNQEEFQEELDFCETLLRLCFHSQPEENNMDR